MSIGNTKDYGNKGNNFPYQLKSLQGLDCVCSQMGLSLVELQAINANTDDVEFLLSAILTTLQANTEYEAKFVVDTCNSNTVYLEVRVWNPDTSTWGPITYYLPGSDTPVIPPGAATPGCLIYTDPSGVLALILGAIQAGNLILTDIETNTEDTITELQNLLALYTAGQSACADSLSVTLCTEQGLSLSAIENNTANIVTSTAAIDIATTAISADTTTIVSQLNSQVKTPVIERISGISLTISVAVRSISIACPNTSGGPINVSTDGGLNYVQLFSGEAISYDAGTLNNYFAANLFKIDCTLSPGDALITYII
jgi:hypothetical protein